MGYDRIYIMTDRTKPIEGFVITNPYSGNSAILTKNEHDLYLRIKQDEIDEKYDAMQKGLRKFSRMNASAYMTLLD